MADNETIADIIAWLRRPREGENAYLTAWRDEITDRLEAAWKRDTKELRVEIERLKEERNYSGARERERLRAKGFAIVPKEQLERGDASELRDVCEKMLGLLTAEGFEDGGMSIELDEKQVIMWRNRFLAALAAPPRNCDVGTAQEQSKRKQEFCYKQRGCGDCSFSKSATLTQCALAWAQMPYEEGGAK